LLFADLGDARPPRCPVVAKLKRSCRRIEPVFSPSIAATMT
jgi:hypothetical protein